MFENLYEIYPEANHLWVLTNKISEDPIEIVVTMDVLESRFPKDELTKIMNGSHQYWDVFKKY